jgi:hypothetical protein
MQAGDGLRARAVFPLLLQSVRTCGSTLTSLVLDRFRLTDADLHLAMIKLPQTTRRLQTLSFKNNEFGTYARSQGQHTGFGLTRLRGSRDLLGPASIKAASGWRGEGVEQLASVVASGAQMGLLSVLNLSDNRLSDEALVLLSKGISQTGCRLAGLDLSRNNFGREGARGTLRIIPL